MRDAHDDGRIGSGIGVETTGQATAPPPAFHRANAASAAHAAAVEGVPAEDGSSLRRNHQLAVAQDPLQRQRAKIDKRLQRLKRHRSMDDLMRLDVTGENSRAARVFSQENELGSLAKRSRLRHGKPIDLRRGSARRRDDRHPEINQGQNLCVRRRLPGRDIGRVAPFPAHAVQCGLRSKLGRLDRSYHDSGLQLPQGYHLHAMRLALAQNQVGALARGQDVFLQIHEVDGAPKLQRLGDRLLLRQL
jgi:hypothetical protein